MEQPFEIKIQIMVQWKWNFKKWEKNWFFIKEHCSEWCFYFKFKEVFYLILQTYNWWVPLHQYAVNPMRLPNLPRMSVKSDNRQKTKTNKMAAKLPPSNNKLKRQSTKKLRSTSPSNPNRKRKSALKTSRLRESWAKADSVLYSRHNSNRTSRKASMKSMLSKESPKTF